MHTNIVTDIDKQLEKMLIALKSEKTESRLRAAATIQALGERAAPAVPALMQALDDISTEVQEQAAKALAKVGRGDDAEAIIPALIDKLGVRHGSVRRAVTLAIKQLITSAMRRKRALNTKHEISLWARSLLERLKNVRCEKDGESVQQVVAEVSSHLRRLMGPGAASDGISGTGIQGSPTPVRESDVCRKPDMTVCYPTEIFLDDWHTMLAYLHLPEHLKTVKDDSRDRLSSEHPARSKTKPAQAVVVRGAEIVVVPELDACEFNPPSHRFTWLEDWHRAEFRFRLCVSDGPADRAVNGRVAFYAESVLIGEVPTSVYITEGHSAPEAGRVGSTSARPYDAVFVSYSHLDEWIAKRLSAALRTLGMEMLRDVEALRSGEEWNARLLELIDKADIFQLYWSNNAKQSPHVEKEWRWALAAQRSNFIRPVYWERPVPDIPDELKHIHFSFYEMV